METLCDDLLGLIMERVSNSGDRKSCSEVCKLWYKTEALTRVRVRVQHPEQIPNFLHRFTNLTTLVVDTAVSDQTLEFVSVTFPKLRILNLSVNLRRLFDSSVMEFGNKGLSAVAAGCRGLREVLLSRRKNVGDDGVVALQRNACDLTVLDLSDCASITDASLEVVAHLGSLSRLNLSNCPLVTDLGLDFLSSGPAARSLRVLDISGCVQITDIGVCSLKMLSFLEELNLCSWGGQKLTDAAGVNVASISSLRKLNLSMQNHITDKTLIVAGNNCRDLAVLKVPYCSITNISLDILSSGPTARSLRVLDISFCEQITDVGICHLKRLPCLEELNLCACGRQELTDVAGVAVASISSLRKLNLSMQDHITDETLIAVANNCRDLVEILLGDCEGMMDQGVLYLAPRLSLERIYMPRLFHLKKFSPFYLMKMAEKCPSLRLMMVDYGIKKWFSPSQLETLSTMCKFDWV